MANQENINSLNKRKVELHKFIDISTKEKEAGNLEKKSQENGFWDNPKDAELLLKKLSGLKSWLKSYDLIELNIEELSVLLELGASEDELKELLTDLLSTESINKRGIFSSPAVHQLILDNDNGKIDASYTLLSLLCIEIWCRAYIDH